MKSKLKFYAVGHLNESNQQRNTQHCRVYFECFRKAFPPFPFLSHSLSLSLPNVVCELGLLMFGVMYSFTATTFHLQCCFLSQFREFFAAHLESFSFGTKHKSAAGKPQGKRGKFSSLSRSQVIYVTSLIYHVLVGGEWKISCACCAQLN